MKTPFVAVLAAAFVASPAAQQPNPLSAAASALGADKVNSIQFTGSGASYTVGQAYGADGPWPKLDVKSYTASIDYDAGRMRVEAVRTTPSPLPPGVSPFQGEQRQVQMLSGNYGWNVPQPPPGAPAPPSPGPAAEAVVTERKLLLLSTPHGFLKAAAANKATTKPAGKATEVTFTVDGKYRVAGRLNAQNQVERVQTWIDNPVFGDMPIETLYGGYRDFGGVMFPSTIQQSQGGKPTLELKITEVRANAPVDITVPESVSKPANPPAPIQVTAQQVAPGVHYLTGGSHHSVAIEMRDHSIVIEAPQSEARALAVIAKTKEVIPNKPIRFVVNTHVHFDHSSGLRAFVDEGATVVTHRSNRPFYEKAWAGPRTLNPDRLAQSKKRPQFQTVNQRGELTDGARKIDLLWIPNRHTSGMLIAYLPAEKFLIEVDLYSPLAANAPPPATPNPFSVTLADFIREQKLEVAQILALHGPRITTMEDLNKAIGRSGSN